MAKISSTFVCQQCGYRSSQFLGKCPECNTWNSLVETLEENQESRIKNHGEGGEVKIVNLADVEKEDYERLSTNIREFDRVLGNSASPASPNRGEPDGGQGGGIVKGSVVLVAGDPGVGKSTLLLQLALGIKKPVLYISGEESAHQIKIRAERISKKANLPVLNETDVDRIIGAIEEFRGEKGDRGNGGDMGLVIVDSIQTLETSDLSSAAGSVGQVRECAHRLQRLAKTLHIPIFIVGHVNKEGSIAGPKTLEHLVDVVLSLEGDPSTNFRILRSSKNRFGPTDEVGIFEMEESGMKEVKNPSDLFLSEEDLKIPGSCTVVTLTGLRPLLVEIQALVSKSFAPIPTRRGSGIDNNRLQLLVAVIAKRLGLPFFDKDIFVNVTGGLKLTEPAVDLGVCLAIISSFKDQALKTKTVAIGEVGLLGEVRVVRGLGKRIAEAKKLGFSKVISSENSSSLQEAVKNCF